MQKTIELTQPTVDDAKKQPIDSTANRSAVATPIQAPSLEALLSEVCRDAQTDTANYLLRSNTSHDGE
ncbi:hypothetical protein [Planctomycetes bacterium K23_9]|uniref:Uncharacterized protein n=1 Tax=Stieleria marina TaxID=1930275 RepID=A0A517NWW0_9BACT|nr:hypothetical protein K239x_36200 [Planctomycetes bacterium K23_9]